jgi:hypothetical protein
MLAEGTENRNSRTWNNLADKIAGHRSDPVSSYPIPGDHSNNWNGYITGTSARDQLRDVDNLDFRPKAGSDIIDAGKVISGITDGYVGSAPDIGAYEYGDNNYWIPGRQEDKAATPVPPNGGTTVKLDADLMWLQGIDAISHDVYFGTNSSNPAFQGNQTNNIFSPGALAADTVYYWRIDTVTPTGTITGDLWSFDTFPPPAGGPFDFYPTDDTFVNSGQPSNNYGTTGTLRVGATSRYIYAQFDVTGISGSVTSATFKMKSKANAFDDLSAYGVTGTWDELTLTWNTDNLIWGSLLDTVAPIDPETWYSLDVTGLITGNGTYTIGLQSTTGGSLNQMYSKETAEIPVLTVVTGTGGGNNPPSFTSDPVVEVDGTEDVAYSSTLADDATDPDVGDTLFFSMVTGPAWLSVAGDGTLSGTPTSGDVGLNSWTVQVDDDSAAFDQATLEITVNGVGGPVNDFANADIAVSGTVSGSYSDTLSSDDAYESITEIQSGGKPSNRHSLLEHKWTVNVTGGSSVTFFVEAYHTANSEGDDFIFAYSTDDSSYTNMVTVTKTADDDTAQSFALPGGTSGTVYIRVVDTDSTKGNSGLDTVYIDQMYIRSDAGGGGNNPPAFTSDPIVEINATEAQSYSSSIADDASDPDSDPLTFSKISGPAWLIVASSGALSGTPGAGDIGLNSFTVEVDDGQGGTDQATLEITVDPAGGPGLPGQAGNPSPADGATKLLNPVTLSWTAGTDATSHDVYFGTSSGSLTFQGNQTGTTFDPGSLAGKTNYYWRIDEVNAQGTTTGTEWTFKTK